MASLEISGILLARNTLLNLIGQAVPLLVGIGTIPFIICGLGTERFGILSLAWVVLGYFSIFDLGLGRATTKYVAEALGKGEEDKVSRLVWTAVTVQAVLGLLGTTISIGITPLLVERVLSVPPELAGEIKTTFYLLALSISVVLISGSFSGLLEAKQRFDLLNAVRIPSSALTFLLPLIGIISGLQLPGIVILIFVSRCAALSALLVLCLRIFPPLRKISPSVAFLPDLISYGSWITASNALGPIILYLDRFLIGALLTMSDVARYTVPFEVTTRLGIIPSSLVMALFPAFSTMGTTHMEDLHRLYVRSIKYLILGAGPIVLVLVTFANNILRLWIGADFAQQSTSVFQILLLGALVGMLAPISGSLLQGLGRPDILPKLYLVEMPLNIGLVWFLVKTVGITGAALSFAFRALLETIVLFVLSSKFIQLPYTSFVEKGLWRSIGVLLGFGAMLWVTSLISLFLFQVSFVAIAIISALVITWWYVLDQMDKKLIKLVIEKLPFVRQIRIR
jgi:O-antigen/teichoic acid export membrane protein